MITVHKSPVDDKAIDSTEADLTRSTKMHIKDVKAAMGFIADALKERSHNHDHTKLENIEAFQAAINTGKIKETDWYKYHITEERHHLKSHVPENVNLIDVIEHICDCTMAGLTRSGSIYDTDISPEVLMLACENTVKILKAHTEVLEDEHSDHFSDDLLDMEI